MSIQRRFIAAAFLLSSQAFAQNGDLGHGKIELRGFGGGIGSGNVITVQPAFAAGVEGAIGINRFVALTGDYVFDHLGSLDTVSCFSSTCYQTHESLKVHEFMGGFRFSFPNRSRITPYAAISAGGAAFSEYFSNSGPGFNSAESLSTTHFAMAIGPGVNYRISSHTGIAVDVRGVAISFGLNSTPAWFIRTTGGFYFRF